METVRRAAFVAIALMAACGSFGADDNGTKPTTPDTVSNDDGGAADADDPSHADGLAPSDGSSSETGGPATCGFRDDFTPPDGGAYDAAAEGWSPLSHLDQFTIETRNDWGDPAVTAGVFHIGSESHDVSYFVRTLTRGCGVDLTAALAIDSARAFTLLRLTANGQSLTLTSGGNSLLYAWGGGIPDHPTPFGAGTHLLEVNLSADGRSATLGVDSDTIDLKPPEPIPTGTDGQLVIGFVAEPGSVAGAIDLAFDWIESK